MCIRDSPELSLIFESLTQRNQCATMEELFKVPEPKPEAAQAAKDRPAQQQGKQAQPAAQQPSQAQGCLLYTSVNHPAHVTEKLS